MAASVTAQLKRAITNLPDGFRYEPKGHRYFIGDEEVVNVTSVTDLMPKYGLVPWAENTGIRETFERAHLVPTMATWEDMKALIKKEGCLANDHKKDKGDIGTIVHKAAERLVRTGKAPRLASFDEDVRGYIQALAAFWMKEDVKPLFTEVRVYSKKHRFAGTLDLLDLCKGGYRVRDFKTSNGVYDNAHVQVEGYIGALLEMGAPSPAEREIVHLRDDGTYELIPVDGEYADFLGWLPARRAQLARAERSKAATAARREAEKAAKLAAKKAKVAA